MLHSTLCYTSRPREAERYVGGGTLSVSQTASRSSIKPAQPARAEPKLHASIIININIASIIIFQLIWIIIIKHHNARNYGSHSFGPVFASELA